MKVFTSNKQKIGKLGEELAKRFLVKHGYFILEENYTKKYGEMDLIAKKDNVIHFIEVKSIVFRPKNTGGQAHNTSKYVPRETYDPLQNIHPSKLKRLSRVIQVYLLNIDKYVSYETLNKEIKWQFDVITVIIDEIKRIGTVKHIKDIII